ncbi:hypothetical protein GOV12_00185 [Candidatus Pacearchaeota archaeon]|nr:hypothetical protein [Candidatus Pacearchaeota archaeon]
MEKDPRDKTIEEPEVERLKNYLGKDISIEVLCRNKYWDYSESEDEDSFVSFNMVLDDVTDKTLIGRLSKDYTFGREYSLEIHPKGKKWEQPFDRFYPDGVGEDGGGLRRVVLIRCGDEVLYEGNRE